MVFIVLSKIIIDLKRDKIKKTNIIYGFGGIARLGQGDLPAKNIIIEHYRLKSNLVILARSFCNLSEIKELDEISKIFNQGIKDIRDLEESIKDKEQSFFIENKKVIDHIIKILIDKIQG